ncbi:uncharacterized protein EHS24_003599 [Apiotrichum porosum]|uniref:Uncharacterized protein n=1 Tax=Apiotrichum porosum TaxID=105984 RepID=A0A427XEE5_9TREE|nr:uncharacterized protein EHS24_003599 [Apiotrichum porosum]RSH77289.1 hypothetical protein EHS24_003599 [Apiotrichum porosum]
MSDPSTQFLHLVSSLLSNLSPSSPVPDAILLQLHVVFGPMLTSALQLVDRRDVVKVCLPGGRVIHQVTSSAGAPYTLYLDLPAPPSPPPPTIAAPEPVVDAETDRPEVSPDSDAQNTRIGDDVRYLKALYCPCAGFAFNSLTGGRNVFVSEPQVGGHGGSQAH